MVKKICAMVLFIVAMSFSVTFASMPARMIDAEIFDNTQTLSKSEIQTLTNEIQIVQQKHGVKIGIEFLRTIGNANISNAAHELLKRHYSGEANGGIIFVVVMDSRSWYIATYSEMKTKIPNAKNIGNQLVNNLRDKLIINLRDGNYFGACEDYINAVDKSLSYYEQKGAAYDSDDDFNIMALGAAIMLAILFGMSVRSWLIGSMSNVHYEAAATDYLKRESVKFIKNKDTYLYTDVERRPKPSSNNHNSRGGGGGHSGGGGGAGGSF